MVLFVVLKGFADLCFGKTDNLGNLDMAGRWC